MKASHDSRRGVWSHEAWTSALGEGVRFFAHVDAHSSKLVLHIREMLNVLSHTSLKALGALNLQLGSLPVPSLGSGMPPTQTSCPCAQAVLAKS
jgi:hypothetical protein